MPCDSVGILSARLDAKLGAEIVGQSASVAALLKFLQREYTGVTKLYDTPRYVGFSVATYYNVILWDDGRLEMRASRGGNLETLNAIEAKIRPFLEALALASAKQKLTAKLTRDYRVTSNVRGPAGARLLTLEI